MKYKIVLIHFPFDDFTVTKLRPALCLTNFISKHNQLIFAAITSNINNATEPTDIIIEIDKEGGLGSGLKMNSVIKTHKLITASDNIIQKIIGELPANYHSTLHKNLISLFTEL